MLRVLEELRRRLPERRLTSSLPIGRPATSIVGAMRRSACLHSPKRVVDAAERRAALEVRSHTTRWLRTLRREAATDMPPASPKQRASSRTPRPCIVHLPRCARVEAQPRPPRSSMPRRVQCDQSENRLAARENAAPHVIGPAVPSSLVTAASGCRGRDRILGRFDIDICRSG